MNKIQLLCCFLLLSVLTYAQDGLTYEESWPSEEEWVCEENEWWENGEGEWVHEDEGKGIIVYCDVTPDPEAVACPFIYDPVCGYPLEGGEGETYSNSCVACNSGADHYYEGECPNP